MNKFLTWLLNLFIKKEIINSQTKLPDPSKPSMTSEPLKSSESLKVLTQINLADDKYFDGVALPLVLVFEGLYSDVKNDYGGRTMKGITQKEYDSFRMRQGLSSQSVKDIQDEEVRYIYYHDYWLASSCQVMPQKLAYCVFDTSVNSGLSRSIKILQKSVEVKIDGVLGDETLKKMNTMDSELIYKIFLDNREQRYRDIVAADSTQEKFLSGWLRRVTFIRAFLSGAKTLVQIKKEW